MQIDGEGPSGTPTYTYNLYFLPLKASPNTKYTVNVYRRGQLRGSFIISWTSEELDRSEKVPSPSLSIPVSLEENNYILTLGRGYSRTFFDIKVTEGKKGVSYWRRE